MSHALTVVHLIALGHTRVHYVQCVVDVVHHSKQPLKHINSNHPHHRSLPPPVERFKEAQKLLSELEFSSPFWVLFFFNRASPHHRSMALPLRCLIPTLTMNQHQETHPYLSSCHQGSTASSPMAQSSEVPVFTDVDNLRSKMVCLSTRLPN